MKRNSRAQSAFSSLIATLRVVLSFAAVFLIFGFAGATAAPGPRPIVVRSTLIPGPDQGVRGPFGPFVVLADLDYGYAAGMVRYYHGGYIWVDVYAPFLWLERDNSATLFKLREDLAEVESRYITNGVTPDGKTVVGAVVFLDDATNAPWVWTREKGLQFLDTPSPFEETGGALAVSKDGNLISGIVGNFIHPPIQAAIWKERFFELLPSSQPWSTVGGVEAVRQRPMTTDGKVIVGASGEKYANMQATSWVDGTERPLATGNAVSSGATFVTDGGTIFGTGTLPDGRIVLMRWDSSGNLETFIPPNGLSVVDLRAVNSTGTAAGGSLAVKSSCISSGDPDCDRAPFFWTRPPISPQNGIFTILPENGHEHFFTYSVVTDISDDARIVTGSLIAGVRTDGDPPDVAFLWRKDTGMVIVNDLMPDRAPDYYSSYRLSRNGNRVLVTGNPPQATDETTKSLILDLIWPTDH
ncbi:MAG TPA: hypothetical protein VJU77_09890 [Chthoniobacterales bacterium]|nr:hypothetical protein [Chthoniobacterales bacterium]